METPKLEEYLTLIKYFGRIREEHTHPRMQQFLSEELDASLLYDPSYSQIVETAMRFARIKTDNYDLTIDSLCEKIQREHAPTGQADEVTYFCDAVFALVEKQLYQPIRRKPINSAN